MMPAGVFREFGYRLTSMVAALSVAGGVQAVAQVPPSPSEIAGYTGLHAAAASGDSGLIVKLIGGGADPNAKDGNGRTPLHVAAFLSRYDAVQILVSKGADARAYDNQRYDIITIAAVKNDVPMVQLAIDLGADPKAITSPYEGTALIAAAHLGHDEVVKTLIRAGASVDHINNLGWTALIESIVLGDGGRHHVECLQALLDAGANPNLADRSGVPPLRLAQARGFSRMVELIEKAGGQ